MEQEPRDGWRYIVLLATWTNRLLVFGTLKSLGLLLPFMCDQLDAPYSVVGFYFSLWHASCLISCPIANYLLLRKINQRCLTVCCSLGAALCFMAAGFVASTRISGILLFVSGCLTAPVLQASTLMMEQHFGVQFGSANAAAQIGSIVGATVLPILTLHLYEAYGPSGTFLCLGGLLCHNCVCALTLKRPPNKTRIAQKVVECEENNEGGRATRDGKCIHEKSTEGCLQRCRKKIVITLSLLFAFEKKQCLVLTLCLGSNFLLQMCIVYWSMYVFSFGLSSGLEKYLAAYLPVAGALGGILSRILHIFCLYYRPTWCFFLYIIHTCITAGTFLVYPAGSSLNFLVFCSFVAGFNLFGAYVVLEASLATLFRKEHFPFVISCSFCVSGSASVISVTFSGYLYDMTQSFETAFMIFCGICVASSLMIFASSVIHKRYPMTDKHLNETEKSD